MKMIAVSLGVGTLLNLCIDGPGTLAAAQKLPLRSWALLVMMAVVCTVIGYTVWFFAIRDCPVNVVALTIFSQSIFGVLIASFWLGEHPHWGQLTGSIAIVGGLILGLSRQIHQHPPPRADQDSP
jgi:drug/metabolite transporter (DMT)-like permease